MRNLLVAFVLLVTTSLATAQDRVQVVNDKQTLQSQMKIASSDGRVDLADVFRAVSRYNGYDDSELGLPAAELALDGRTARWTMAAVNRVLKPCVRVRRGDESLDITVDRVSARRWVNRRKSEVRWAWNRVDWRSEPPEYGIEFVSELDPAAPVDIVVLVHGLNSRPEDVAAFIPLAERANLVAATFRYPNDQPIDKSSKLLSDELIRLAARYPKRKVRLLTHSMGGLVARHAIETELDPGNVTQLIMVAPPNHGSALARVATFMDCYECFTSPHYRRSQALVESVSDGLGEATADLTPGSVFLDRLNQRQRNPHVRYTILLGTNGPMLPDEMRSLRTAVRESSDGNAFLRFVSSKLNSSLEGLDEVVEGKGDGVVACSRGELAGVSDVVELPFSHAGVLNPNAKNSREAHAEILKRLES